MQGECQSGAPAERRNSTAVPLRAPNLCLGPHEAHLSFVWGFMFAALRTSTAAETRELSRGWSARGVFSCSEPSGSYAVPCRAMLPQDVGKQKPRRVSEPVCGGDVSPILPRRLKSRDFPLSVKRRRSGSAPERKVNCVLVGDGAVGKTSLIVSYTTNGYPTEYVPTAFDNFTVMVVVDGKPVRLQLCDMAGQKWGLVDGSINDELERLRPLCYKNADVFLLCYSVVRPCSFRNLTNRWVPEIRQHCPGAPLILVGTQLDLREDVQVLIHLAQNQERPVCTEEGQQLAQELGAVSFAECSALTQKNLKDAFDSAILASIQPTGTCSMQQQRLTLRKKTPDKIKSLSETWWRKINCLMGEQSCEFK